MSAFFFKISSQRHRQACRAARPAKPACRVITCSLTLFSRAQWPVVWSWG